MTIRKVSILCILIIFLSGIKSCKTVTRLSNQNLNYLYDETQYELNPEYRIFHHFKDSSTLYYRISSDELKYTRSSEEEPYMANYKIHYRLIDSYTSNVVTDSLTKLFSDTAKHKTGLYLKDSIILAMPGNDSYVVHLTMTDMNSQLQNNSVITANKTGDNNFQYYKFYKTGDNDKTLLFFPMISKSGHYTLKYKDNISKQAHIGIYSKSQPVALPTFYDGSQQFPEMEPDTTFQIYFDEGMAELQVETAGIYWVKPDAESVNGTVLYYFFEGFPNLYDDYKLYPLRYLTSSEEFAKLVSHPDPADAADIFWTTMAGTYQRGTKTVDRFYYNVKMANKLFTTWKEGWKTDRGMIYSVFGPPDRVAKVDNSETWTYYGTWRMPHTEFVFRKTDAPLGQTCYELDRHTYYRNIWFQVIENLRR